MPDISEQMAELNREYKLLTENEVQLTERRDAYIRKMKEAQRQLEEFSIHYTGDHRIIYLLSNTRDWLDFTSRAITSRLYDNDEKFSDLFKRMNDLRKKDGG